MSFSQFRSSHLRSQILFRLNGRWISDISPRRLVTRSHYPCWPFLTLWGELNWNLSPFFRDQTAFAQNEKCMHNNVGWWARARYLQRILWLGRIHPTHWACDVPPLTFPDFLTLRDYKLLQFSFCTFSSSVKFACNYVWFPSIPVCYKFAPAKW